MTKHLLSALALFACCPFVAGQAEKKTARGNGPNDFPQATFFIHRLGTDHAEGIAALDMNGDGQTDILSGAYWYENPGPTGGEWRRHQFRAVGIHEEFVSDCGEWVIDVNHDGAPDLVTAGWITNGLWWYENPKRPNVMWPQHFITDSYNTEGGWLADVNGDGKPDLVLVHYKRQAIFWVDFSGSQPKVHHAGEAEADGHGVGIADIDGDGRSDILTPDGWLRNVDAEQDRWEWHPEWKLGEAGFPIIGYDVNQDGKMDIIFGRGHSYGVYWLEQQGNGASRTWSKRVIDESFSQAHALAMADIDGDGEPELLTGKRYRAHNGGDPGAYDPLVVYYYRVDRKSGRFTRHPLSVNGTAGVGTQFLIMDLDGDGDVDIATAGKTGVHYFENLKIDRVPKEQREKEVLLERNWPFQAEGSNVQQEDVPTPK